MADKWHDINHPGVWRKPDQEKPDSGTTTPADPADDPPQEDKQPLVKLSEGKFVPPGEGAEINKKCPVQVNVEYLDDSAKSMQKVTFSLYANYNDTTSNLSHYVDGYEKDGVATTEMTMYPPPDYQEGDSVDYFFKAEHIRGEKVIDSEDLTLPQDTQTIVLQKGDYDENGAQTYNKNQSGDNFKPNNVLKKLQGDLITTNFLPQGSDDGFFGDQTDKAVNDFQDNAIKSVRMKRSVGKTENTVTTLDQQVPDGIVGKKTRDELDKWLQNNWVKPIPTLRHGEYDDTGVDNGKGKRGTDDHHLGTPVVKAQRNLQKVGVYSDGAVDGWFYDKMLDAVKLFQDVASKGMFLINDVLTDIGEKLSGYQKGEHCAKTQEYLKKVVDKGGKVPAKTHPAENIKDICEKHWAAYNNDCSGFAKAVAIELNVQLTGQANDIVDQIQKNPWKVLKDGKEADSEARLGKFVIAGLKADDNGHVAIIVPGSLAHEKYPTGYWGSIGAGMAYKNTTINYSWDKSDRDKVIYASIQI
jgi:hypothetical protein